MSWSINAEIADSFVFDEPLVAAFEAAYPDPHPGVREQFEEAVVAARALVDSGMVGEEPYQVALQGYATQDGEDSTSNSVSLSVIGQHKPADE